MGRSPPNSVGSRSPTARSSIFLSPLTVLIVVPFRKQLAFPFAQPFPTGLSFPQFAEAGFVFETLPRAANATIAPIFTRLRRVRCVPEAKFSNSLVMVLPLQACAIQIRYIILFGLYMRNKFTPVCPLGREGGFRAALFAAYAERAAVFR